ncbi:MAG: histidine kinase [Roseivirga sp.]|nr:histidine kinase [Roseivirga sp.]
MNKEALKRFIRNREVWGHLLLWVLLFSSLNVSWTTNWLYRGESYESLGPLSVIYFVLFFYGNSLWLLPRYFKRKTWYKYFLMLGMVVAIPELIRSSIVVLFYTPKEDVLMGIYWEIFARDSFVFGMISPVWVGFFSSSAYYFIKNWNSSNRKIEQLEMEKLSMELNLLKSQINPHFLFNNLNALDDLIDRDKQMAREYLHRLSKILRYSISSMENDVVTLQEEWDFIDDYIYLIEERFGKAYQFEKIQEIDRLDHYLIPPASLQNLVENVVKHNQGSIQDPLKTTITLNEKGVEVNNPKRLKQRGVSSLGTGLKNVTSRYRLLTNKEIEIVDGDAFSVTLPLISEVV